MQIKTKNQIPSRRIKKRYFAAALLMAMFSSSAVILSYRAAYYMEVGDFCLEPYAGKDRVIKTYIKIKKDYTYWINLSVTAINGPNRRHYQFTDQLPERYGKTYYTAGTVLPYTLTLKKEWFSLGEETEFSFFCYFEPWGRVEPDDFEFFSYDFRAGSITPMIINPKLFPFKRDREKTYASFFGGKGLLSEDRHYIFDGTGFKDEYLSNHLGVVPLNEMHFTPTYYSILSDKLSMSSGELQILNYIDDFDIGEIKQDSTKRRKYRSIPLELVHERNYAYLRSKDPLYVKSDLRFQTSKDHKSEDGWYETKQVILPPLKGFESKKYEFRVVMNDTGECCIDQFVHSFKVERTANAYGSKYNSDFFVREILDA